MSDLETELETPIMRQKRQTKATVISLRGCAAVLRIFLLHVLKTDIFWMTFLGFALGYQHFTRDLANVNEWKIMFDPSNVHIKIEVATSDEKH